MKKRLVHVVHKFGVWTVEEEGAEPIAMFQTRELAVTAGRELAQANHVELIVHRKDGSIGERTRFDNGPLDIAV